MLIRQYAAFVARTDQFSEKYNVGDTDAADPREIAIFGLASEIGSVISAMKKEWLNEGGALSSPLAKAELEEELGDAMWYAFALARIEDAGGSPDILVSDIEHLQSEVTDPSKRGARIREVLPPTDVDSFLDGAEAFKKNSRRTLSDYQHLAFKTARTDQHVLLQVCAAVLTQLSAQLMRHLFPEIETELNTQLKDRPMGVVLGEVAWHLCAIASLYDIDMNEVGVKNMEKASARQNDGKPTPLHDSSAPDGQRFPRNFEVEFRSIDAETVEIYWKGERRGDPLRDQYSIEDGYRFHDVLHLANVAVLGWSPVLRDLFKIKRTSCPKTKQEEDGGRSAVVEELVIKLIHWEASRRAKQLHGSISAYQRPLFPDDEEIPFSLLKQVREVTIGHEVYANKYWEWALAIREGYRVFELLKTHQGGFVRVDLDSRRLDFRPPQAAP
jgi:NTP pyrophosphatase (non-canonical NTP hydrolase)